MLSCTFYLLPAFDNVSRIRRSNSSFKEGFMVIKVLKSENDQLPNGGKIVVLQLSSAAFPVQLLKMYLAMFKIPPNAKDFIFKPICRGKGCCKLVVPDKPISYSTIRGAFHWDMLSLVCILCDLGEPLWQSIMGWRIGFSRDMAGKSQKHLWWWWPQTMSSSIAFPWALKVFSISHVISPSYMHLAQFFVSLCRARVGSLQASQNNLIWFTLLCYLLWSGDKIWYFWRLSLQIR